MTVNRLCLTALIIIVCGSFIIADNGDTNYSVGTGIWDVTGPAAEINMVSF